jgi:hypothetical protein
MTEYSKLRELASAATPGPWMYSATRCEVDTAQIGNDGAAYDHLSWGPGDVYPHELDKVHAVGCYIAACSPDVVVGLLDQLADRDAECVRLSREVAHAQSEETVARAVLREEHHECVRPRAALDESIDMTREATNPLVEIGERRRLHMRDRLAYLRTVLEGSRNVGAK